MKALKATWTNGEWPGPVDGLKIEVRVNGMLVTNDDTVGPTVTEYPIDWVAGATVAVKVTARFETVYYEDTKEHNVTLPADVDSSSSTLTISELDV